MNYNSCTYISWEKYDESPEIQIHNGDILVVKTGSSFGKCAYVDNLPQKATINPQFVVLKYVLCQATFLTYILQSSYARQKYDEFVLGTAIPTFTQVVLGDMLIPLPPLAEQQRIVSAIEQWFSLIDVLDNAKDDLQASIAQAKSKILDLAIHGKLVPQDPNDEPAVDLLKRINPDFTPCDNAHYTQLPQGWAVTPLTCIGSTINGLWKGKKPPFITVGVIRNANFTKDFRLDYSKIEYIDIEERSFEQRHLINGDLIVEKSGGSDNFPVGRAVLYKGENKKYSFSNFTMALRIYDKENISPDYIYYYLLAMYRSGLMHQMQTQTTGLHNLILEKYLSIPIFIPPINEQKRILSSIETLFNQLDAIAGNL